MENRYRLGPAVLVTAAFIGPGTVLTASSAGASYGFGVLWAIAFSAISAIVLQNMAARLGIVTGRGIAESIRQLFENWALVTASIILVLGAILFGNSAYQTGNILGAAKGLDLISNQNVSTLAILVALIALAVIWIGRIEVLQWLLTGLVALMGLVFVVSAIASRPDWNAVLSGFWPRIPTGAEWAIVGLIGTTVVPYNLFLHASAAAQRYKESSDIENALRHSRMDTLVAIGLGGVVTAALTILSAATFGGAVESISVRQIAEQLVPTLGSWAKTLFAIGLFSAGLSSAITAPIAAAFATAGCFGWDTKLSSWNMKSVASGVLLIGLVMALWLGSSPTETIIVAQIANGLLLPIVALFLMYILNRSAIVGENRNGRLANLFGAMVVIVTMILACRQFNSVWQKLGQMFTSGP